MGSNSPVMDSLDIKELTVGRNFPTAGRTGRPAYFFANVDAKVGVWFNAAKAQLHFGSAGTGEVTGQADAFNAELYLPNKHRAGGVYFVYAANLDFQASSTIAHSPVYPIGFMQFKANGTAARIVEWADGTSGCIFSIDGIVSKAGAVVDKTQGPAAANASFKILMNGTEYWVMCSTTAA